MNTGKWQVSRRDFLRASSATVAALLGARAWGEERDPEVVARFGLVTDAHFADIDTRGSRHYRESIAKMTECIEFMNEQAVDFLVELGDFTNGAEEGDASHLETIEAIYASFRGPRFHVLGNHDLDSLSKAEVQARVENTGIAQDATHYAFDNGGVHVVVLDANFNPDGTPYDTGNFRWDDASIPQAQLDWLEADLAANALPTIICIHQLLDEDEGMVFVRNAAEVRAVLERHPEVLAVFQGHHHAGSYQQVGSIHYYTLKAMVEGGGMDSSSYAIVEVFNDGSLAITGYRRADSLHTD